MEATEPKPWTTKDELSHIRKLGQHGPQTAGDAKARRVRLLKGYLLAAHNGRDWGEVDKDLAIATAEDLYHQAVGAWKTEQGRRRYRESVKEPRIAAQAY